MPMNIHITSKNINNMKKITKTLLLALLLSSSAGILSAQKKVTVKGRIEGISSGRLFLLAQTSENQTDTIGSAQFKAPHFVLEGEINEPIVANIVVEKYSGGFTFIAEPGVTYQALLTDRSDAYIRGGQLQDEWTAYASYSDSLHTLLNTLKERHQTLLKENKYRAASKVNDSLSVLETRIDTETQAFIQKHDDLITAYTVQTNALMKNAALEESIRMYESMGPGAKNTPSARIMKERIDRMKQTQKGVPAPDFTLPDLNGNSVTLSKVPAKLKIVDFWASWCGPCRMNNPALKKVYELYHSKGLEIISISLDNKKERWAEAVKKDELTWINVSSLKGWKCSVARQYNVTGVPAIYILDENNHIVATNLRGEKLTKYLQETFK